MVHFFQSSVLAADHAKLPLLPPGGFLPFQNFSVPINHSDRQRVSLAFLKGSLHSLQDWEMRKASIIPPHDSSRSCESQIQAEQIGFGTVLYVYKACLQNSAQVFTMKPGIITALTSTIPCLQTYQHRLRADMMSSSFCFQVFSIRSDRPNLLLQVPIKRSLLPSYQRRPMVQSCWRSSRYVTHSENSIFNSTSGSITLSLDVL